MLVVRCWRSFACPGSQAEGKRYHDWDGCIERITQLDAWPDVRTGSSTESLGPSISHPLFPTESGLWPMRLPHRPERRLGLVEAIGPAGQRAPASPCEG